ncbi:hypothetical protein TIFTF001_037978 [Ficus carica]|uniref:DUF8039 domain-containing protein n=1 Tax=Ficus carica TaxID=3494 RepID=A0AA88EHT0_FICCA|nr:hypothetical protein TIFTF001_037978 [Ficus carica]
MSTQTQMGKPRHTNSPRFNPDEDGKRRATLMRRIHLFENTGQWPPRHTTWLDMHVKPDGEFKNPLFKIIGDTKDDFSKQETQESFESVRTYDILTKSLGNAEHSGRIRGQSKFVKQSQYFNIVQSPRENAEVFEVKRQLAALKRTVQPFCAKHGINRPMPNASEECHLFLTDLVNVGDVLVAIGRAYIDCVPTDTVHEIPLGEGNVQVTITVPKLKCALLPIPTLDATYIEEAVGGFVAWPKRLVVLETSLSQASRGPSHAPDREAEGSKQIKKRARRKKIQSQPEVQQHSAQQELPSFDFLLQQSVDREVYVRERANNILRILTNAPRGKLFLMPYNSGQHWILAFIDP